MTATAPRVRERTGRGTTVFLPLLLAAGLGIAAGVAPVPVAVACAAVGVLLLVLLRLEWLALLLVAASLFEDYTTRVAPGAMKALAALLVLAWIVRRCRCPLHSTARRAARSPVIEGALLFTVALLVATAVHNNGTAGLTVASRYAGFLAVLFVLVEAQRGGLAPERLARAYVVAAAIAAGCGLATFALGLDRRAGGPIGDPNDFAFFLVPAVALSVGVRSGPGRRWWWDAITVLLLVTILATLSRGALVGLLAMGLCAVLTGMARLRVAVVLTVAGAVAAGAVALALPGLVSVSLEQKDVVAAQNVSERLSLWEAAGRMTLEHPVVGMGPGAFSLDHEDFLTARPDDVNHPLDVAHNTWLEVSSELGVLGLLAFVALLATAFAEAWTSWRRCADPIGAAVAAGLVGAAVAATFVTEQYYLPLWLLCALAAGVAGRRSGP